MVSGVTRAFDSGTTTAYEVLSKDGGWSFTFSTCTEIVTVLVSGWLASSTASMGSPN